MQHVHAAGRAGARGSSRAHTEGRAGAQGSSRAHASGHAGVQGSRRRTRLPGCKLLTMRPLLGSESLALAPSVNAGPDGPWGPGTP